LLRRSSVFVTCGKEAGLKKPKEKFVHKEKNRGEMYSHLLKVKPAEEEGGGGSPGGREGTKRKAAKRLEGA